MQFLRNSWANERLKASIALAIMFPLFIKIVFLVRDEYSSNMDMGEFLFDYFFFIVMIAAALIMLGLQALEMDRWIWLLYIPPIIYGLLLAGLMFLGVVETRFYFIALVFFLLLFSAFGLIKSRRFGRGQ